jgi:hypothetical protein
LAVGIWLAWPPLSVGPSSLLLYEIFEISERSCVSVLIALGCGQMGRRNLFWFAIGQGVETTMNVDFGKQIDGETRTSELTSSMAGDDAAHPVRRFAVEAERQVHPGEWLFGLILVLLILLSLGYVSLRPRQLAGETLGVIVLGNSPRAAVAEIAAAGGQLLRDGTFAGGIIVRAPDAGFVDRLSKSAGTFVYRVDGSVNCAGAMPGNSGRQATSN